ncbi:hypothetical protein [uncultured Microbulbifer sp.]|uniref:hypothetical protein n=1 Tax=uncultured Microbulbifer sp. TaxID=348147 RepID=UPI00262A5270|nr:hypothetical protein [uncultured Microbulbifer sp.]
MINKNSGQSFPEYLVGVLIVGAACFTPLPPLDDKSIVGYLVEAFKKNYRAYEYAVSQPTDE